MQRTAEPAAIYRLLLLHHLQNSKQEVRQQDAANRSVPDHAVGREKGARLPEDVGTAKSLIRYDN